MSACWRKSVRERLEKQLSTSWRIGSSGNHSLSMYASSCGSPCLILHACRECHNAFTSHSSISWQGQAREENCLCVSVCVSMRSCSIHMHVCVDSICLYAYKTQLLTHSTCLCGMYVRLFLFIHVHTVLHHLYCSTRLRRPLNLN